MDEIRPGHYKGTNGIECFDAMEAAFGKESVAEFCINNALKYIFRHRKKHGLVDIDKAIFYLTKYRDLEREINGE